MVGQVGQGWTERKAYMSINTALDFHKMGISVIPVREREKKPALRTWEPYKTKLSTEREIETWFVQPRNLGVITGWRGLVVVDFDDMETYTHWQTWAARQRGITATAASTAYSVSTSRGVHVYIRLPHTERSRKLDKVDVKGAGGYVLGAGSIHPTGVPYTALRSSYVFPLVPSLSFILPEGLLNSKPDLPKNITLPGKLLPREIITDPWESASRATWAAPGEGVIAKIREAIRIEDFFDVTHATGGGRWLMTNCPLHDDAHPSFWIDTQNQICGCHAGCTSKPLDVINLAARLYGLSNREAVFELARRVNQ